MTFLRPQEFGGWRCFKNVNHRLMMIILVSTKVNSSFECKLDYDLNEIMNIIMYMLYMYTH